MSRLTIRLRLTLLYSSLLLLAGVLLLAVTYVLISQNLPRRFSFPIGNVDSFARAYPADPSQLERIRALAQQVQDDTRASALSALLTQGGVALLVITVAALAFGWLIAGRALQPLHQITGTARRIARAGTGGRGLHERIALVGPADEVKELADTFDLMLERLDQSFDGQRRFVANASHELRTPLAINRSLVELAITRPDASPDLKRLGESLLSVNERHERLIDGLLTLADSEHAVTERSPLDLADVLRHLIDRTAGIGLTVTAGLDPAPVLGDPELLERLAQNLVENALRHNLPGGWLKAATGTTDGSAWLTVSNTGPMVPGYEIESLFRPFYRLRTQRAGRDRGFGLGLSIVRAVARAHGGDATAVARDEGGLVVTVRLPAIPAR